jgi:hypothetical protein
LEHRILHEIMTFLEREASGAGKAVPRWRTCSDLRGRSYPMVPVMQKRCVRSAALRNDLGNFP